MNVANSAGGFRSSVLVVSQEPTELASIQTILDNEFSLILCGTSSSAAEALSNQAIDIMVVDQNAHNQVNIDLFDLAIRTSPQTIRIFMADRGRLDDAIEAINAGRAQRYLFKPCSPAQLVHTVRQAAKAHLLESSHEELLKELRRFNLQLERKVHERTLELEHANQQLHHKNQMLTRMALTDPLTGLPNRRAIDRLAKNEILRRTRYQSPMAIGLIDVDYFHDVNVNHLLSGGDHALVWLGQILGTAVRTVDTIGRVGGEEFMLVAPETDHEGALILAERIRSTVESNVTQFNGKEIRITVSLGMVVLPAEVNMSYDEVRLVAAAALGEAKSTGRNRSIVRIAAEKSTSC